jgi:hypothetical protein
VHKRYLNLLVWVQVLDSDPPAARGGHSMEAMGNTIIVCGGTDRILSDCGNVHLLELEGVDSCVPQVLLQGSTNMTIC